MARSIEIVNGPNKFDMMLSLLHGEGNDRHWVEFVLAHSEDDTEKFSVFVWSMEREGMRDSEQWVIKGLTTFGRAFQATYSTKTRKGHRWIEGR